MNATTGKLRRQRSAVGEILLKSPSWLRRLDRFVLASIRYGGLKPGPPPEMPLLKLRAFELIAQGHQQTCAYFGFLLLYPLKLLLDSWKVGPACRD